MVQEVLVSACLKVIEHIVTNTLNIIMKIPLDVRLCVESLKVQYLDPCSSWFI